MKVTLAKALKVKNQVVGRVARLQQEVRAYNRVIIENKNRYDVNAKYDELVHLSDDLVGLKRDIALANAPIQQDIIELAEAKSMLAVLQSIPCDDGVEVLYEGAKIEYFAHLNLATIEAQQQKYKNRITSLQDRLDKHNSVTEIEVKDHLLNI